MKKLLQINSVVNTGSTGRISEDIGNLVISNGWESYIAYGRHGNKSKSVLIKFGSRISNFWHILITRIFDKHGFGSKSATKELIKKIKKINPDIIHLHNIHGYYINIEILFNFLSKNPIPVVWTFHDCWAFTGHCVHFENIGCHKWKTACSRCPQTKSYPQSLLFDRSKNNYIDKKRLFNSVKNLTIVPVSYWLQNLVEQSFLKDNQIKTIQNGIDLDIFKSRSNLELKNKLNIQNKFIILGVASFWGESKGLYDCIKLSQKIGIDDIIILVGLKKEQMIKLPKNIIGIEKTDSPEELAEFYSISNVFLNLTYADTFPTTNLEALACGTPIITYRTGGSTESVSSDTGFVINQGDERDLLSKIQIIKSRNWEYYKEACVRRAKKNYDKNERFKDYLNLYNDLLKNK